MEASRRGLDNPDDLLVSRGVEVFVEPGHDVCELVRGPRLLLVRFFVLVLPVLVSVALLFVALWPGYA